LLAYIKAIPLLQHIVTGGYCFIRKLLLLYRTHHHSVGLVVGLLDILDELGFGCLAIHVDVDSLLVLQAFVGAVGGVEPAFVQPFCSLL